MHLSNSSLNWVITLWYHIHFQSRESEYQKEGRESQGSWYVSLHWWSYGIDPLQRKDIGQIKFTRHNSCHKLCQYNDFNEEREMGYWFDIYGCRLHLLVIMVPSTSLDWKDISVQIFQQCLFVFLQCNSVSHLKFDNREGLYQMDFEGKTGTNNSVICCKYPLSEVWFLVCKD